MTPSPLGILTVLVLYGSCLWVFGVGFSATALAVFVASAYGRGILTLAGHHRYFAHRSFRTSRGFQFAMALTGATCLQGGPLGWAAMHRHHHRSSDGPDDVISPVQHGYSWTQLHLWIATRHPLVGKRIHDFDAFPELLWLERHWWVAPVGWAASMYALGAVLAAVAPALGTSGAQLLVWGCILANAYIIQTASLVNAACHRFGSQPFDTGDGSRNNGWVSLVAVGEGWHNNHHRYPWAASNRVEWWQLDPVYMVLRMLAWLGLVWDLRLPGRAPAEPPPRAQRSPA